MTAGYFGLCLVTWLTLGHARLTSSQAELRTILGAAAWSLFGIAWVRSRHAGVLALHIESKEDPNSTASQTRKSVSGVVYIGLSLLLVTVVFWRLGLPPGDGRGVLVTAIELGWALWLVAVSGTLAAGFEHKTKGWVLRLLSERTIILAFVLTAAGVIIGTLVKL